MQRIIGLGYREAIDAAMTRLPFGLRRRVEHIDWLCGVDPVYAGLHGFEKASFGRSFRDTAHCSHRHHSSDSRTTIVLPTVQTPEVIIHELAHALDEAIDWRRPVVPATTNYARADTWEAWAEFVTAGLVEGYGDMDAYHGAPEALAVLAALSLR